VAQSLTRVIPPYSWFYAIFIFSNAKSSISAKELEKDNSELPISVYGVSSLTREALRQDTTKLKGNVEIDTGYFGGKGCGGKYNKN
jgi:hypothetical protein